MSEQSTYRFEFGSQRFELLLGPAVAAAAAGPAAFAAATSAPRDPSEGGLWATAGVLRSLSAHLGAGDLVLDWGAGLGAYAVPLASLPQVRVVAFEADAALRQLLMENARRNGVSLGVHAPEALSEAALGGPPKLVRLDADAAEASLRPLSALLLEHQPLLCVCSAHSGGQESAAVLLRTLGYAPRAHLGAAQVVLYSHDEGQPSDVPFQIMTAVEALSALIETRTTALREALDAHARQTRGLLDEQLVHARRVDAELFDLKRRLHGSLDDAPREAAPSGGGSAAPTALRKLRKLVRDPRAFVQDSRSLVVRRLGKKVVK